MALRLNQRPTFWAECTAFVPDGEAVDEQKFRARFRAIDTEAIKAFDLNTPEGTEDFIRAALMRVDGVEDSDGKAVEELTAPLLDELLRWSHNRAALIRGYLGGYNKALMGN